LPLPNRVQGCLDQKRVTANDTELVNLSLATDNGFQDNGSLNASLPGQWWIRWLHLTHQVGLLHIPTHANSCGRFRSFRWWRWRRRGDWTLGSTNHTS